MLWRHPAHPVRAVRLAYGLNVHPAETLDGVLAGIGAITLPLRERLASGRTFGVGMYLAAPVALRLASGAGARELKATRDFLAGEGLDPFTFNAFPYGGFHGARLKQAVFEPTWLEPARAAYTAAVARIAVAFAGEPEPRRHISISTHTGMHSSRPSDDDGLARAFLAQGAELERLERESGWRTVLSFEPEPRSNCNDTADLARLLRRAAGSRPSAEIARHLGVCVDACHAAVEFETPEAALDAPRASGVPLGKLQFTSAIELAEPASNDRGRELLLALDEPRYLHQVTGRGPSGLVRAGDLPEIARAWGAGDERWRECDSWRCHFHVPVDLETISGGALATTRAAADALLALALARPDAWGTDELHVEIETYTWDVLPRAARGAGEMVDGLEREYRHVFGVLERSGWRPA